MARPPSFGSFVTDLTRAIAAWEEQYVPEHAVWLTLACAVLGVVTAPGVPGAGAQALACMGAAAFWGGFLVTLRGLTWRPWRDEPVADNRASADNVVLLRPGPRDA